MGRFLGVDLGSHGCRVVVLDGVRTIDSASISFGSLPPARREIKLVLEVLKTTILRIDPLLRSSLDAIAVTGVRGAVAGLDRHGGALTPVYPDFEAEAVPMARRLVSIFGAQEYLLRTGCPAFPLAGLPKMMLHPGDQVRRWQGVQEIATRYLTGEDMMSAGSALRLGVLRADGSETDSDLLAEVGVSASALPQIVPVGEIIGTISRDAAKDLGLTAGCPVAAGPGDVPAALFAVGGNVPGVAFVNLGTSIVVSTVTSSHEAVALTCEILPGARSAEAGSGAGGATLDWLAKVLLVDVAGMDLLARSARPDIADSLSIAPEVLDPWGDGDGGQIHGITPEVGREDLVAAVLDAVADAAGRALDELEALVGMVGRVVAGGGASASTRIRDRLTRRLAPRPLEAVQGELAAEGAALVAASWLGVPFESIADRDNGMVARGVVL